MWWPPARERMLSTLPRARYVVMVRDPVDRAWSHYWYMRARVREDLDFEAALDAEEVRLEGADLEVARTVSYVSRGRYAPQVAALLEGAGADAVHVVGFPQLRDDPAAVVDGVLRHLRLAPRSLVPSPDRNTAVPWRSSRVEGLAGRLPGRARRWVRQRNRTQVGAQPVLPDAVRRRVAPRFAADRAALEDLLGGDPLATGPADGGADRAR